MLCGHCEFDNLPLQPRCWLASLQIWREARCHLSTTPEDPSTAPRYGRLPTSQCAHSCVPLRVRVKSTSLNLRFSDRIGFASGQRKKRTAFVASRENAAKLRCCMSQAAFSGTVCICESRNCGDSRDFRSSIEEFLGTSDCMAERVGLEFTRKRRFNNIEHTAGTVKQLEENGKQC
jgi:hypothetical protein